MTAASADVAIVGKRVIEQVERVVVGKRRLLEQILTAVLAGGHVLLEDYPGLAKTLTALSFAQALGLDFKRIQFTPDLLPSDITGSVIYDPRRASSSCARDRSSPISCWPMRLIAPRRRPNRRCWRRCRKAT